MWAETGDVGALLNSTAPPHWARAELARRGRIQPLDTLAGPAGFAPLGGLERLVIAQPRPLSPQENVALDAWVRRGGRLLLLADPALTEDSAFALGDPRRPQPSALLSPILARWSLQLTFDEAQALGEVMRDVGGIAVPTNLAGSFAVQVQGGGSCRLLAQGLAAICTIGRGRVVALADAAVLERSVADGDAAERRRRAFAGLLDLAFAAR